MRNLGVQSGGALGWLLQRVTGATLLLFIIVHTVVSHYTVPPQGITYEWVMERLGDPYWKLFYLFFLFLLIYHALNGLWTIFQDYIRADALRVVVFGLLVLLAVVMFSVGVLTIVPLQA
jgi:succinate dehydrogenase / fumarate reductase membrane anchor subunit